jgi:hypothetical protein
LIEVDMEELLNPCSIRLLKLDILSRGNRYKIGYI